MSKVFLYLLRVSAAQLPDEPLRAEAHFLASQRGHHDLKGCKDLFLKAKASYGLFYLFLVLAVLTVPKWVDMGEGLAPPPRQHCGVPRP